MFFHPPEFGKKRYAVWSVALIGVFGLGVYTGNVWGIQQAVKSKGNEVQIKKIINLYSKTHSDTVDFNQFWTVWDRVKSKFVDQPVDETKLFYGALSGILQGLNDPYSVYFPPKEASQFAEDLSGEFFGIGAEIGIQDSHLVVIAPIPSSPAEHAGLKPKDRILAIAGMPSSGFSLEQAVKKIRGPEGTSIILTILHDGAAQPEDKKVTRQRITIPTVIWEMKSFPGGSAGKEKKAYIRITYFNQDTWHDFDKAVNEIIAKAPTGIILDLRSNPGGYLDTSVEVASEWIKDGLIVRERLNNKKTTEHTSDGLHRFAGIPTVVLIDGGTASGSEIVAGALQDYGVATLIGSKTFGKGSVQAVEPLPDGSALKITIAKWFTPKDRQIDHQGIQPDIVLDEPKAKPAETPAPKPTPAIDAGLEKAFEILNKK